jgi:hypothetical protein
LKKNLIDLANEDAEKNNDESIVDPTSIGTQIQAPV